MEAPSTYEIGRVHALGALYHVPHGISVATGLRAALEWNVTGAPDAYADAAVALGCRVDGVPAMFATLCNASGMAAAMVGLDATLVAQDVAATMNAVENQPMLNNNARPVTETDHGVLAERTVEMWHLLRS